VAAATTLRVLVVGADESAERVEQQPGRVAAFAELVRAAEG
jgi:hypothetical protein